MANASANHVKRERWRFLLQLTAAAELPMAVLSAVWLVLLILDLAVGLSNPMLIVSYAIWAVFILHFLAEFIVAPNKRTYLRRNWVTAVALVLPAFRILRVLRVLRFLRLGAFARSLSLMRVLVSLNRGMKTLRRFMARRGLGYVLAVTVIVYFLGAAGMLAFEGIRSSGEPGAAQAGFTGYAHALWWTAMIIATMGTDYWPQTGEGRLLCSLLALYGFSVFGYITATLASHFVGGDRKEHAGDELRSELRAVASELSELRRQMARAPAHPRASGS